MLRGPKEKKERALGEKLFLKGERCLSPKCAVVRRPYRPGAHGRDRRRALSEFGQQLQEKQKIRLTYGLKEAQFRRFFKGALKKGGESNIILEKLERRLDNVIFRLGFAVSRSIARQTVSHSHILVNNKIVNIPSYEVKIGDIITIKPTSKNLPLFKELSAQLKKYEPPSWLALDKEKLEAKVVSLPSNIQTPFNINLVVEYYSR